MTLIFIILNMNIKKITECNVINSINPLADIKGQFKKGKDDNVSNNFW